MEYIRALKIIHRTRLPMIEDFFNSVPDCGLSFNEFLVQAHFDYLKDHGKLTAKNMFYKLPPQYHWIAKKFVINQTNRVKVDYSKALRYLNTAIRVNQRTERPLLEYQQAQAPIRLPHSNQTPTHNQPLKT